jgi:hypothetical protein
MSLRLRVLAPVQRRVARWFSARRRSLAAGILGVMGVALMATFARVHSAARTPDKPQARTFTFTYAVQIPALPPGSGPIDIFVP